MDWRGVALGIVGFLYVAGVVAIKVWASKRAGQGDPVRVRGAMIGVGWVRERAWNRVAAGWLALVWLVTMGLVFVLIAHW